MIGRAILWASNKERVRRFVCEGNLTQGVVRRFVAGNELDDAVAAIAQLNARGIGGILDLLGEGVTDAEGAQKAAEEYLVSIKRIEESGIDTTVAVKPTQLGLAFDKGLCIDLLRRLAAEAQAIGTSVEIDMEQSQYVVDTLDVYRVLSADFEKLRVAVQAYLRRTPVDLETLAAIPPRVRLVKGAYAEPEHLALQKGSEIDAQYRFLTAWLLQRGADPAIATHDDKLIQHAHLAAGASGLKPEDYEIQMLYGVRRDFQEQLARQGYRIRVYVPYGSDWYPYLMRRMAERPANLRFFMRALVRG